MGHNYKLLSHLLDNRLAAIPDLLENILDNSGFSRCRSFRTGVCIWLQENKSNSQARRKISHVLSFRLYFPGSMPERLCARRHITYNRLFKRSLRLTMTAIAHCQFGTCFARFFVRADETGVFDKQLQR